MRDLVRDAALITSARLFMESGRGIDPEDFSSMYSESSDEGELILKDLNFLGLAYQKYESDRWGVHTRTRWVWNEDKF